MTVYVAVPPRVTVRPEGVAEIVKSGVGGAFTVKLMVVLRVTPPLLPSIVIVKVPVCVALLVTMLKVELAELLAGGVTDEGLNPVPGRT